MNRGRKIVSLAGIDIAIDPSWLLIAALMTLSLLRQFWLWHPDWRGAFALVMALLATVLFFGSILLHELAHSLVARAFGIRVRHILLFLFGGMSDIEREPQSPKAEFFMAVVGPLTSIALGVGLVFTATELLVPPDALPREPGEVLPAIARMGPLATLCLWLGPANIALGLFNCIPGFPLDGGRVLRAALWVITSNLETATRWASGVGRLVGWTFIALGIAMVFGVEVPLFGGGVVSGLWIAFIGWFLTTAATGTYANVLVEQVLSNVKVGRLMRTGDITAAPDETLATVSERFFAANANVVPVLDGANQVLGLISIVDLRRVEQERWPFVRVDEVMKPLHELVVVSPHDPASEALRSMARDDVGELAVADETEFVGMIDRSEITRYLELHLGAATRPLGRPSASH